MYASAYPTTKRHPTMTKMQKDELYDEMCHLLTDYENNEDATLPVSEEDLYDMLVKIQNNWEELTGEDE